MQSKIEQVPRTEQEALSFIMRVTADETITIPAAEIFKVRRAKGDALLDAYESALRAMIGKAG